MQALITIIIVMVLSLPIVWLWINGIDHMKEYHPNYKGEDFLSENYETEYHYNADTKDNDNKKKGQKKQVSQKQTKAK